MTGDPIADVVVGLVEALVREGVHLLDPAARAEEIRRRVREEAARWPALDPGLATTRQHAIAERRRAELRELAAHADRVASLLPHVAMAEPDRVAVEALVAHARASEHEARTARAEDDTARVELPKL